MVEVGDVGGNGVGDQAQPRFAVAQPGGDLLVVFERAAQLGIGGGEFFGARRNVRFELALVLVDQAALAFGLVLVARRRSNSMGA